MNDPVRLAPSPPLACLGGAPAPPQMAADLRRLTELPEAAQRHLWEALGPSLAEPISPEIEQRLTEFCRRFDADDAAVARALKASRHLLRAAAAADLDRSLFAEDVARLAGEADAPRVSALLLAGYDAAKALIRGEIAQRTLVDHEGLASAVDYRVEQIISSTHGENLRLRVLALTFRTSRGGREERVSVRLGPAQIEDLLRACEKARG